MSRCNTSSEAYYVGDVIYVHELVRPEGVLKTPISYANRTERFYEAHSYGIRDYVRLFLIPRLGQRGPANGAWKIGLSLRDVESTLVENKNMFVMHNLDDFLVSIEDLTTSRAYSVIVQRYTLMAVIWATFGTGKTETIS
jgi:hypothetical protein